MCWLPVWPCSPSQRRKVVIRWKRGGDGGDTGAVNSDGEDASDGKGCEIDEERGADDLGMVYPVLEREDEEEKKIREGISIVIRQENGRW